MNKRQIMEDEEAKKKRYKKYEQLVHLVGGTVLVLSLIISTIIMLFTVLDKISIMLDRISIMLDRISIILDKVS